tara:strand:- start:9394 stop:10515 length:1122 start_codon:yes stop_codon:yes gene_type:complete
MKQLYFLEKLLDGVEVEWLPLKDIAVRTRGTRITAAQMKLKHKNSGAVKIFAGGKTVAFFGYDDLPKENVNNKPSIIVKSRGIIDFEFYNKPFSHKNEMWSYHSDTNVIKYIFHYLKLQVSYFQGMGSKMQMPQISTPITDNFLIPIPFPNDPKKSLEIQNEIVRILDTFIELTTELTTELTNRKKQYQYYREQFFDFDDEVERIKLGQVARIKNGKDWKKLKSGKFPVYGSGGVMTFVDQYAYNKPTVLIPRKGSITNIFYVEEPFWNVDTIYYTEINTELVIPKFFYYYMRTIDLLQLDTGSGRPSLTQAILNEILVPIPSLSEQQRIVNILGKFDTLTQSISEGLPREIELRQKQYEYYRDQLFNFSKPE